MRRVGSIVLVLSFNACGPSSPTERADAGGVISSTDDALAKRRRIRETFVVPTSEALRSGTRAASFVPSPIAPMPDHSGRYVVARRGSATFFTASGMAFALSSDRPDAPRWGLHCTLVGAREGSLGAEDPRPARVLRHVGASDASSLPTFARMVWEDVHPGVDLIADSTRSGVAYRYVLSPGANVSDLVMRWSGAIALRALDDGRALDLETPIGVLQVRGLQAFALHGDRRVPLVARYVVRGNDALLEVDGWSGRVPLVIDPTLTWASYMGGIPVDAGARVAVDGGGNVFVVGSTESADFPSVGGFDTTYNNTKDAFVSKVSGAGALLWSTYLGGSGIDEARGVAVDASGNVIVVGATGSSNFPAVSGFDTSWGGLGDAFVTKLAGDGTLLWSSFLGGALSDKAAGVAVDASGNVLVVGTTSSVDFPTAGGFDTVVNGPREAFVTKFSGAGALVWSTYLGGGSTDDATGIAVDGSGSAFVVGNTGSSDFPVPSGFDTSLSGSQDAFAAKISSAGALLWSSYLGGNSGSDWANDVAVDALTGDVFVTGATASTDFPSAGGFDTTGGGSQSDGFVTKLTSAGALAWSSYLGGSSTDRANGIAVDAAGDVYVTGATNSTDFPTRGGFDTTAVNGDAFVTKIRKAGTLAWSSYLGGSSGDEGRGIAVDANGNVFVTGFTQSKDFPTLGGFDTTFGHDTSVAASYQDVFLARLAPAIAPDGASCPNAGDCVSGNCVDGVCCDTACDGKCEACIAAKKGGGVDGACGPTPDGADPALDCAPQACADGVVSKPQVCTGTGVCRSDGTISCGFYACAGAGCATNCATNASCLPGAFCSGAVCVADLERGAKCSDATHCKSGFCADGVCCDKACTGACEACTAASKGSGVDGACAPVAADTDPKDACPMGTGACTADGACDGAGACRSFAKAGTPCGPTTCAGDVVSGIVCRGDSATCVASASIACSPYACDGTACKASCARDADCASDAFCTASGACARRAEAGTACGAARECASGNCVDGVCCNTSCAGVCESCNEPSAAGTCTAIVGAPRGARPVCDALAADDCGKTVCDGTTRERCAGFANGATTPCGASACTADKMFQKKGHCDAAGTCAMPTPIPCTPYVCDASAATGCKVVCASSADCIDGYSCRDGACNQGARCSVDRTASVDKTGKESPCAPYRCADDGECRMSCASTDDCAAGTVCDPGAAACVEPATPPTESGGGCSAASAAPARVLVPGSLGWLAVALLRRQSARRARRRRC